MAVFNNICDLYRYIVVSFKEFDGAKIEEDGDNLELRNLLGHMEYMFEEAGMDWFEFDAFGFARSTRVTIRYFVEYRKGYKPRVSYHVAAT